VRRILAVPPSAARLALLAPLALLLALGTATTSYAAPTGSSELDATSGGSSRRSSHRSGGGHGF